MALKDNSDDDVISLFAIAHAILAQRRRTTRLAIAGFLIASASAIWRPTLYKASAAIVSSQGTASSSNLAQAAGLAAQLGLAVPLSSSTSTSPEFYVALINSRELLGKILDDTVKSPDNKGEIKTIADLLRIKGNNYERRQDDGVAALRKRTKATIDKKTGIIQIDITTRWPAVSLHITQAILNGLTEFNQAKRRSQARAEREFLDVRRDVAENTLRTAEDRLKSFLLSNRKFETSPQLILENERLKRDLLLKQQVYSSIAIANEDAKLREVRDLTQFTVIETPRARAKPEPRGRILLTFFGLLAGVGAGICICLLELMVATVSKEKNPDTEKLFTEFQAAKLEVKTIFSRRING